MATITTMADVPDIAVGPTSSARARDGNAAPRAAFAVRFSPDGGRLAVARGDDSVDVLFTAGGKGGEPAKERPMLPLVTLRASGEELPAMAVRWVVGDRLLSAHANGQLRLCDAAAAGQILAVGRVEDAGGAAELYALDSRPTAPDSCVVAGKGSKATVYAVAGDGLRVAMSFGQLADPGQPDTERLYSVRLSADGRRCITAGWGRVARLWDLRAPPVPVLEIPGPDVRGDGLDLADDTLLTVSYAVAAVDAVQLWDLRGSAAARSSVTMPQDADGAFFSCGQLHPTNACLLAVGGRHGHARVVDFTSGAVVGAYPCGGGDAVSGGGANVHAVYGLDFSPDGRALAVGGACATVGMHMLPC